MEIKNLKKAASRIIKAVKNKENIILYGDADPDGMISVVILKEAINTLGEEVLAVYFPDREKNGYGINERGLINLKKYAPALFIALDVGITNFKEIDLARNLGFEVIIIDHHQILDNKLPNASIIVNPKQKGDKYPFKELATCGITFKLSKLLLKDNFSKNLEESFLELAAIGTMADLMPQTDDNKEIIEQGLIVLENTFRPGLRVFLEIDKVKKELSSTRELAQKIISALNSGISQDHLNEAYLLLVSPSLEQAKELAEKLIKRSYQKKIEIKEAAEKIEKKVLEKAIFQKVNIEKQPVIFEGDSAFSFILAGAVASRICNKYKKPTFIFKKNKRESIGSVRMPKGFDAVEAMKNCSSFLENYGGHAPAAGFRIRNKNLEKFEKCLNKYFSMQY